MWIYLAAAFLGGGAIGVMFMTLVAIQTEERRLRKGDKQTNLAQIAVRRLLGVYVRNENQSPATIPNGKEVSRDA